MIRRKFRRIMNQERDSAELRWAKIGSEATASDVLADQQVIITSEIDSRDGSLPMHAPVIDIDFPVTVIPSTTPGKYHLYIDVRVMPDAYFTMLDAMAEAGVVERGYAQGSRQRGYSGVRLPWVKKPGGPDG